MEAYIYKIELNDMIYIGSTKDMKMRQWRHNSNLRIGCTSPIYKYCRENNINQVELILLECVDIDDRYIVEQYYIDEFKGDKLLNALNASFDRAEYMKTYKEANKDKINTYKKTWSEANKDKLRGWREANKEQIKEYREANREKMKEYQRLYRARKKAESN